MHSWSVLFNDVVLDDGVDKISNIPLMSKIFDGGVDKISNIPLMSKIFDDGDRFGTTCILSRVRDIAFIVNYICRCNLFEDVVYLTM